jgi:hypothetical protein
MDIRQFVKWFSYIHHSYKPFNDYLRSKYNLLRVLYHLEKGFERERERERVREIPSMIFWKICFVYVGPCQTSKKISWNLFYFYHCCFLTHSRSLSPLSLLPHTLFSFCMFGGWVSEREREWATLQDFVEWYLCYDTLTWGIMVLSLSLSCALFSLRKLAMTNTWSERGW